MKKLLTVAAVSAGLMISAQSASAASAFPCYSSTGWCSYSTAYNYGGHFYGETSNTANIQNRLMTLGYFVGERGANGVMNASTRVAVKQFQRDHGLLVDGVVGPQTASALNLTTYAPAARIGYGYYGPYLNAGYYSIR